MDPGYRTSIGTSETGVVSFFEYAGIALGSVLGLYIAARVISAAFFRSKRDFDQTRP